MPDTIDQQLISAIDTRLKTILVAGGYRTNLGQHVHEWQTEPLDQNVETYDLNYRSDALDRVDVTVGGQDITLHVTTRVRAVSGTTSLSDMRKYVADVVAAMLSDPTFGGLCDDTNVGGPVVIDKEQAADTATGAEIKFKLEYQVDRGSS